MVQAGIRFPVDDAILARLEFFFPQHVVSIVTTNNIEFAKKMYDLASQLPSTATNASLELAGVTILDVCSKSDTVVILFGHKGLKPVALKRLFNQEEAERLIHLSTLNIDYPSVIPFELLDNGRFMVMPRLVSDLQELKPLTSERQYGLWADMSSALHYLHSKGVAHMDVKPSNIGLDGEGKFVLIDIGNAAPLGQVTDVTDAFVPSDFDIRHGGMKANALVDVWLLATTFLAKLSFKELVRKSCKSIMSELKSSECAVLVELTATIADLREKSCAM